MTRVKVLLVAAVGAGLAMTQTAIAQDDEGPSNYIYATYHYCNTAGQEDADAVYDKIEKPIGDKMVADGKINAFGYLRHHTGGKWRRATYFSAPSVAALLDAQEAMNDAREAADPDNVEGAKFSAACPSHDDYIWASDNVGTGAEDRGPAGFSVYFVCNENRESRADEIVADHFAKSYDQLVADGKLASWGWSQHWVGGKYRRLLTMTAADHKALIAARDESIGLLFGDDADQAIGEEFTDICGSHSDYMWDIAYENP